MINIYPNPSSCNYFYKSKSLIFSIRSVILSCEKLQCKCHISGRSLEDLISSRVQELYDAMVDTLDFRRLLHGHGDDWIRNGHKCRTITCLDYTIHIRVQRIYSGKLHESHMVYIPLLLPFVRQSTESVMHAIFCAHSSAEDHILPTALSQMKKGEHSSNLLALISDLYKCLVSSRKADYKVFFSVLSIYQHDCHVVMSSDSLSCLIERTRWCKYEQ
jgi:hypothetical protein